jgi:3-oxo-5-alpha-steroid 4-dehydrogenase 1
MNLFNPTLFNGVLATMTLMGIVVMAALFFIEAGYGMMYRRTWGPSISNKTGWVLMEAPVFIVMLLLWWYSDRRTEVVPVVFLILFEIHYAQRSFIFPLLMRGHNRMPLAIIVMGIVFNVINAYMQGGWIFHVASPGRYTASWLYSPQFIVGTVIFIAGMAINLNSDYIIRHLRKPGDTKHYIPRGGMFRYVSSANYLGEFTEWVGFAILTWSAAGAVFAWWTLANLAPRAWRIHKRYSKEFGKEFDDLHLRCIIPFIF